MSRAVPINPKLPRNFDSTRNEDRPASHQRWWNRPFIVTETIEQLDAWAAGRTDEHADKFRAETFPTWRAEWLKAYPSGTRYDVRCLDGGAWDRSTGWGMFGTLDEAMQCAGAGPEWRRRAA